MTLELAFDTGLRVHSYHNILILTLRIRAVVQHTEETDVHLTIKLLDLLIRSLI